MKKLLYTLLLLNCPAMAFAKITLDVSVSFEQTSEQQKRTIETRHTFDITEQKYVSHTDGDIKCTWQIINEGTKTVSVLAKIFDTKDGVEKEIAHPFLVTKWGQKGVITLGEKSPQGQSNLKVTVLIAQD